MRLSKKIGSRRSPVGCSAGSIRSSADRRITATAVNGTGSCALVAPGGMAYLPQAQDDVVVLSDEKEQICIGVKNMNRNFGIQPGELILFSSGGASIHLTNDGKIFLVGDVTINGHTPEVN